MRPNHLLIGLRAACGFLAVALLAPACASAQGRNPQAFEATHRATCRLAGQVLQTGAPSPKFTWAMGAIATCEETGPDALALVWQHPPTTPADLDELGRTSRALRDARIVTALVEAAERTTSTDESRTVAIIALASYVRASFDLDWKAVMASDTADALLPGAVTDLSPRIGSTPPAADVAASARSTIAALAEHDANPRIRFAARVVLLGL